MDPETEQTATPDSGQGLPDGDGTVDSALDALSTAYQEGTNLDLSTLGPDIRFVETEMQHRQCEAFDKTVDAAVK